MSHKTVRKAGENDNVPVIDQPSFTSRYIVPIKNSTNEYLILAVYSVSAGNRVSPIVGLAPGKSIRLPYGVYKDVAVYWCPVGFSGAPPDWFQADDTGVWRAPPGRWMTLSSSTFTGNNTASMDSLSYFSSFGWSQKVHREIDIRLINRLLATCNCNSIGIVRSADLGYGKSLLFTNEQDQGRFLNQYNEEQKCWPHLGSKSVGGTILPRHYYYAWQPRPLRSW